ncbi:hypothetical protein E2C01_067801 [Portunus trituberculatus]|uniref:Uncharacterized protein n=1 Tax=Portunus trituberculatus TaxID=210409 RepID=A0A5B7HKS7_PORTR|nr:hypothetical protein [Portunus trituberculatus]
MQKTYQHVTKTGRCGDLAKTYQIWNGSHCPGRGWVDVGMVVVCFSNASGSVKCLVWREVDTVAWISVSTSPALISFNPFNTGTLHLETYERLDHFIIDIRKG